jgi:predicted dinucleotide-binding enzyme
MPGGIIPARRGFTGIFEDGGDVSADEGFQEIGKTLIDPMNPLAPDEGGLKLSLGFTTSSAEFIAERTSATVVKSLNQVGAAVLGNAGVYATRPLQFIAGDSAAAKATVRALVEQLGFDVLDAGPSAQPGSWSLLPWSGSIKRTIDPGSPVTTV